MSKVEKVVGTNCYNCLYISDKEEPVVASELNEQGGIDPKTEEEMKKAKQADLITLPGGSKADATNKKFCYNEE